jgi:hypothetical protein
MRCCHCGKEIRPEEAYNAHPDTDPMRGRGSSQWYKPKRRTTYAHVECDVRVEEGCVRYREKFLQETEAAVKKILDEINEKSRA